MVREGRTLFRSLALAAAASIAACSAADSEPEQPITEAGEVEDTVEDETDGPIEDEPEDDEPESGDAPETSGAGAILWTVDDPHTVSGPVAADGAALVQRVSGPEDARRLELVAIDVETGEQLWQREVSTGSIVPGMAVQPVVVDDKAVFFEESQFGDSHRTRVVVADPRTSDVLGRSPVQQYTTIPAPCADEAAICVNGWVDDEVRWWRVGLESNGSGLELEERAQPDADFTRPIGGGGLIDLRRGGHEYLAVHEDGDVLWERPVAQLFGGGTTTNTGWGWWYEDDEDRLIGWIGLEGDDVDGSVRIDLADRPVVALERSTGERLWEDRGVDLQCGHLLSVPSDADLAAFIAGDVDSPQSLPVWCRAAGEATHTRGESSWDVEYRDLSMRIEGFDRATGEVLWSHVLDEPIGLDGDEAAPVPLGPGTTVVLSIDGARVLLDLETGEVSELADTRFWCIGSADEFAYKDAYYIDGEPTYRRFGGSPVDVCDADGTRMEADDDLPPLPNGVGLHVDGARLLRTSDGIIAIDESDVS